MTQHHTSLSLQGLDFAKKYGLAPYTNICEPLIIFGLYRDEDFKTYSNHGGKLIVSWQGSDSKDLTPELAEVIRSRPDVRHYANSTQVSQNLIRHKITHRVLPINATIPEEWSAHPKGEMIYFYCSDESDESKECYGWELAHEVRKKTGLPMMVSTLSTYQHSHLQYIYQDCFINLRLTSHDGCPNTNLEMGLMGRRSIFNGEIPGSIRYRDLQDICDAVTLEYEKRHEPDTVRDEVLKYMDIGNKWMEI